MEQICIVALVTGDDAAVRSQQREGLDVMSKGPLRHVILAVHVVGNGPSDGYGSVAGEDGRKPTPSVR